MHKINVTLTIEAKGEPWDKSEVHMEVHFEAEEEGDWHFDMWVPLTSIQVEWSKLLSIDWWQGEECVTLTNEELKAMGAYESVHAKWHEVAVQECETDSYHDECINIAREN